MAMAFLPPCRAQQALADCLRFLSQRVTVIDAAGELAVEAVIDRGKLQVYVRRATLAEVIAQQTLHASCTVITVRCNRWQTAPCSALDVAGAPPGSHRGSKRGGGFKQL